jgi:hypothetical protein
MENGKELAVLISCLRKIGKTVEEARNSLERIQADKRAREMGEAIQANFFNQGELINALLQDEGFVSFIKELDIKRGGTRKAVYIIAATFPRGRFVTERGLFRRLRSFGWTKTLNHYMNPCVCKIISFYYGSSGGDESFNKELIDYDMPYCKKGKRPDYAICLEEKRRRIVYGWLKEAGLESAAQIIQDKT